MNRTFSNILSLSVLGLSLIGLSLQAIAQETKPADDQQTGIAFFKEKIEPVLRKECYSCHAHGTKKIEGNLLLDSKAAMLAGGDSGPVLLAGKPAESLLIESLKYESYEMPPKKKLSPEIIADFERWISMGAPDPRTTGEVLKKESIDFETAKKYWAFQPVKRPQLPTPKNQAWSRSSIDQIILSHLEANGITPSQDASKEVLLRRATYDLTGLQPTIEQVDRFLQDESEGAFERVIDELLASKHFGEKWGRHWLDVARYADSSGADQNLTHHNAWRYRDYVIDSFNEDKPYDQFILEQMAGDLLEAKTVEENAKNLIATGFLVMGPKVLAERDKEKLRMDIVDEQIDTTGRAFLGLTLGCARCHDHKFDPLPTADYYAMAGIFRSTQTMEGIKQGNNLVSGWILRHLPISQERQSELDAYQKKRDAISKPLSKLNKELKALKKQITNLNDQDEKPLLGIIVDDQDAKKIGTWKDSTYSPHYHGKGYLHDDKKDKGKKFVIFSPDLPQTEEYEIRFSYTPGASRASKVPVKIQTTEGMKEIKFNQQPSPNINKIWRSAGRFHLEKGKRETLTIGTGETEGFVIVDAVQFIPVSDLETKIVKKEEKTEEEPKESEPDSPELAKLNQALKELEKKIKQQNAKLKSLEKNAPQPAPMAMAVADVKETEDYFINVRGNVHKLGDKVKRGFLQVASTDMKAAKPVIPAGNSGRAHLAKWLIDPNNPLTSRVYVNRIWHHLFGEGLVRTVDNFGHSGEEASHPELIDLLASDFMKQKWSTKKLIRQIMLSRVYQQSSQHRYDCFQKDPQNQLLWKMNRRRLPAEAIRDSLLFASNQLDLTAGGSSVEGFDEVVVKSKFEPESFVRRSVYLPVLRNSLAPIMDLFNFSDPDSVTGRRSNTTVPSQALFMMNSPFIEKQAKELAKRVLDENHDKKISDEQLAQARIKKAYRFIIATQPNDQLVKQSQDFIQDYKQTRIESGAKPEEAQLEAWASYCQALFGSTAFRFVD